MNWHSCELDKTIRGPLASNRNQGDLIRRKDLGPSRKVPKNREVTWCYNRQEDLTLFGSTPVVQHNKLSGRPVGRARCRCEARTRCSDNDRSEHRVRSEEHTSELQSHLNLVCRLLL